MKKSRRKQEDQSKRKGERRTSHSCIRVRRMNGSLLIRGRTPRDVKKIKEGSQGKLDRLSCRPTKKRRIPS